MPQSTHDAVDVYRSLSKNPSRGSHPQTKSTDYEYNWIALTIASMSFGTAMARFANEALDTPRLPNTSLN